jgi:hypothetical protein
MIGAQGRWNFRGTFEALILIIEIRVGERYVGLVAVVAPEELDALRPIVTAVAEFIHVER